MRIVVLYAACIEVPMTKSEWRQHNDASSCRQSQRNKMSRFDMQGHENTETSCEVQCFPEPETCLCCKMMLITKYY